MSPALTRLSLSLSALVLSAAAGCSVDATQTVSRAIVETACATRAECPAGFECEREVEHGTVTSFCQADDDSVDCPAGLELEIEHGQAFCRAHGGGADDGGGAGSGGAGTCTTSADCPTGLECEVEIEHGQTTRTCKPHGGRA